MKKLFNNRILLVAGLLCIIILTGCQRSNGSTCADFYKLAQYSKALAVCQIEAQRDNSADAFYALGYLHEKGLAVAINHTKAVAFYHQAADQKHVDAHARLGRLYAFSDQIEQDLERAIKHLTYAADHGEPIAQHQLAMKYEFGEGVERNLDLAEHYFRLSAEHGVSDAQGMLGQIYLNRLQTGRAQ